MTFINKILLPLVHHFLYIGLGLILFCTSCSVQTRQYLSGYHIEWNNRKQMQEEQENALGMILKNLSPQNSEIVETTGEETNGFNNPINKEPLTASINNQDDFSVSQTVSSRNNKSMVCIKKLIQNSENEMSIQVKKNKRTENDYKKIIQHPNDRSIVSDIKTIIFLIIVIIGFLLFGPEVLRGFFC